MTERKEEKSTSFTVLLHKILSSLVVQLHWQRTEDSSVKAAPTRCRKAGRKQMSLVDGWRESSGKFILTRKDVQNSLPCWVCSGQSNVPMDA